MGLDLKLEVRMGEFARLADLFQEGQVLPLLASGGKIFTVWLNKLSPFEQEEARQDGRVAKARMILATKEIGSPEYDLFQAGIADISDEELRIELVNAKQTEFVATAVRSSRVDPDWAERVEVLERSEFDGEMRPDERALLDKLSVEYAGHVEKLVEDARTEERRLLDGASREQLETRYREEYLEQRGLNAFTLEYQRTEVYFALRVCKASEHTTGEQVTAGEWDHSRCDHSQRVCESRAQVATLPASLWQQIRSALDRLNMPMDIARFSAAPVSSSESSEQPSAVAEESSTSTQEEIPAVPAGTS